MKTNSIASRTKFAVKEHSPEILIFAGIAGIVVSTVCACRATLKARDILDDAKEQKDQIDALVANHEEYTEEDAKKDKALVRIQTGVKLVRAYAPAVILGAFSIAGIVESHGILRKRNVALAAAYTAIDQSFKGYRSRVIAKIGEEAEQKLRMNIVEKEIEETVVDEKGKEKKVKKKLEVADPKATSYNVKYLTPTNENYDEDEEFIRSMVAKKQSYLNDKLKASKHLILNDAFRDFGFGDTKAGMVTGWRYDPNDKTIDNYVEILVRRVNIPNEYGEIIKAYALEFNVDGNIYDKM